MTTVMVTGTGAIIGYGILHSLRQARPDIRLVAADIFPDAVGQHWADAFERAPLTHSDEYPGWLRECLDRHGVDLIIPGIEQDVHRYAADPGLFQGASTVVALNRPELIDLCRDKWQMHEALREAGSDTRIPSRLDGDFDELAEAFGLPFLLKPRVGYASKGLVRVRDREDFLSHHHRLGADLMAQPWVGSDDEEYTVAVFGDGAGMVKATITLQRRLSVEGATAKATVRHLPDLDRVTDELCRHFRPVGPTNLQFRRVEDGWRLLEINPRISSSTSLRTAFGYNEADLCVRHYLQGEEIRQPAIRSGHGVRYIADHITYDA